MTLMILLVVHLLTVIGFQILHIQYTALVPNERCLLVAQGVSLCGSYALAFAAFRQRYYNETSYGRRGIEYQSVAREQR